MNKYKMAQNIAVTGMIIAGIGLLMSESNRDGIDIMLIGVFIGWVSYFFAGFKTALKLAFSMVTKGWLYVPFPFDLMVFLFMIEIAILMVVLLPIIPIRKAYKESGYYRK